MSFVTPLFLIGGLAVAVPILLHLIKREHARKIEFPTLMFLRRISKRTIRYQKLRHLLLLLLRVLALLLIVFAFMRPYREKAQAAVTVGRITNAHIIVFDNSLSMGYQDRLDRAKKAAAEIIRKAGPDDKFAILEFSDLTLSRTQLGNDPSDALSQINSLELSDRSTRFGQALRTAEKFALEAGTGKRTIHLISDFQKNGWTAEDQDFRLGAGIDLEHVDVGSDDFSNLSIRDVHISESDQGVENGVGIKASIANFGNLDRKNVQVTLSVDSRSVAEKRIDVAKGGSQGVEFQLPGLMSGSHPAVIEVEDRNLTRDNRFYMTIEARGRTPVLLVENGEPGGQRPSSFFLSKALNIDALSPYKLTTVSPQNFVVSGGLLIWNNASGGTAATQKKLQDFVRAGGGLAVVLADAVHAADFNRSFGSWLPVRVEGPAIPESFGNRPVENYVLMTDVRMDHPIFQPFSRPHSGSFSSARFFRHARMSVGSGAEIPARFDNGDPALVSIHLDKGRVLIFASSADDSCNDLPLKAVYAPFWQQMLHYLENFQERRHWLDVGDTLAPKRLLLDTALHQAKANLDQAESVAVLDPARQRLSMAPGADSIVVDKAGFYEIRSMNVNAFVAVNPIPRESDLTHGNAEEMTAGWISSQSSGFSQDERPTPEEQDRRQRLWSLVLILGALFLISELLLSNLRMTVNPKQPREPSSTVKR
jgi:hypothetical protein